MSLGPDPAKIAGLRQLLARDGEVRFKNGAVVEVVPAEPSHDLRVTWPGTEKYGYANCHSHDQLGRAYGLAMAGPPPPDPPPPAKVKPTRTRRDFGDCPF